jgi:hypothetical protein
VAYFLGKMAPPCGQLTVTKTDGEIPVNIYATRPGTSGCGKGHSIGVMENEFMKGFKKRFLEDTMPVLADFNLQWSIANDRAARKQKPTPRRSYDKVVNDHKKCGVYTYHLRQGLRASRQADALTSLLMSGCGSVNLQVDEIGLNLMAIDRGSHGSSWSFTTRAW